MKILAIESSSAPASIAVTENDMPIGEFTICINRTHSEKLLPLIDSLLDAINLSAADIDLFAVSKGPGSFTGLRIGMAAAKLMAQTCGKPLIGVKTLEALAKNASVFNGFICPMIDARNNTVYTALYRCQNGKLEEISASEALSVDLCSSKLSELDAPILICGEYEKYREAIKKNTADKSDIYFAPRYSAYQRAVTCAVIAHEQYSDGVITSPDDVVPLYVRESQAEQSFKAKKQA